MPEEPRDILLEHNYDGIQEYDNPTPGWWWMILNGTLVFSALYFLFFTFSPASWTLAESYDAGVAANLRLQFGEIGDLKADEPTLLKYMNDKKWLTVGENVFKGKCAQCHGKDAEGLTGPNMTDDVYKNIKKLTDIPQVIANGAANGAMPQWKTQLHQNEIVLTAAYVASLRGKNLPGPRGPEGEAIPPWPTSPAAPTGDK